MQSGFKTGVRVKGKPGTGDEGKTGVITEPGIWVNCRTELIKPPYPVWFVLWDGDTAKSFKAEDELEIV